MVRGLSLGIRVGSVMRSELLTGMVLGAVLGGLAYPLVGVWVDVSIALTVALAVFAASTVATGVAMYLPWLLDRMDLDPAFGSGPLSTVIQDPSLFDDLLLVGNRHRSVETSRVHQKPKLD